MYRKSAVQCEWLFSCAGYIVIKTHSSHEVNTVNMLVRFSFWLSVDILSEKTLVPSTAFNWILGKISQIGQ